MMYSLRKLKNLIYNLQVSNWFMSSCRKQGTPVNGIFMNWSVSNICRFIATYCNITVTLSPFLISNSITTPCRPHGFILRSRERRNFEKITYKLTCNIHFISPNSLGEVPDISNKFLISPPLTPTCFRAKRQRIMIQKLDDTHAGVFTCTIRTVNSVTAKASVTLQLQGSK